MLKTDISEIVCVCFHVLMSTFLFFLDLRAKMTRLLTTDVDIHVSMERKYQFKRRCGLHYTI